MNTRDDIGLVIICYNPSDSDKQAISALASTYRGVIVDNSAVASFSDSRVGCMEYVSMGGNAGVATAQNCAIRKLLADASVEYLVFFDQDSRVEADYPEKIVREYKRIQQSHSNLALLGPTIYNVKTGREYRSVIHKDVEADDGFVVRRDVISSGSVVSREVLDAVGLNDESLFIDFVDFEWCWRAESKGCLCGITQQVHIAHQVGQHELSLGGYKVIISSPHRYFYQYRNHLWLARRRYVPMQWRLATAVKHALRLIYFPFCVKRGALCWLNMWRGIFASISSNRLTNK